MNFLNLRMTEIQWQALQHHTAVSFAGALEAPPETGCLLLITENNHPEAKSLLVRTILLPGPDDLKDQETRTITFANSYLRRALLLVREQRLAGFLTLHTHPLSSNRVYFSGYDDANDPSLMKNLSELQPGGVFGSVVLGSQATAARIWNSRQQQFQALKNLAIIGEQLTFLPLDGKPSPAPPTPAEMFDRALALTSSGALSTLAKMRIAVCGASGTGSLMVELLLRAGVGHIVLFDFDTADATNLNRVLHLRHEDAKAGRPKVRRLETAINESGLPTKASVIEGGDIRDENTAQELCGCDLIIGCVDRDWPRLIMSEVAYQYLIPYIDLGTEIGASETEIQSLDARVSFVGPGRPCLFCSGVITHDRIRIEGYETDERDRVLDIGYSADLRLNAPAVMDLNMRAASAAMLFVRHLLQPYLSTPLPHTLKEAVTNFSNRQLRFRSNDHCLICGRGRRNGLGSTLPLTVRRNSLPSKTLHRPSHNPSGGKRLPYGFPLRP